MSETFYIKQNDTSPALQAVLKDADDVVVDLTGALGVQFHMRQGGVTKVDAAAAVVTPAAGLVEYTWLAADTDTAGSFQCEFEVTYSDSSVETFPNDGYFRVRVKDDIA